MQRRPCLASVADRLRDRRDIAVTKTTLAAPPRRRFGIDMQAPLGHRGIDRAMGENGEFDGARAFDHQRAGAQRPEKKHGAFRRVILQAP